MLVIRGYDMATVALSHINEIDFKDSLSLHIRFLDVARFPATSYFNVFHLFLPLGNRFSHVIIIDHIRLDIVAKQQLLEEDKLVFPVLEFFLNPFIFTDG